MYRPYWIVFCITNTNNHNVGGIEFKNARRPIESPVRFLYNLMCCISMNIRADVT